tara:strand:+ start:119 stop:1609 length:1491 start_codon:yes stop_codon:yes gene_type:complete
MTVIRPNSISGVTSITALQNSIEFYKSDGSLSGANIDGISINTSGIITASTYFGTGKFILGNDTLDSATSTTLHIRNDNINDQYIRSETTKADHSYLGISLKAANLDFQIWNQGSSGGGYGGTNSINFYQGGTYGPYGFYFGTTQALRINTNGQIFAGDNNAYNESASILSLATDDNSAANMLTDSSAIYNHNNPAFIHVQNRYNTGDGQEAGIIFHSKSSFNGSWAIYGKKTTSGFLSDLIFRNRTASSASAERLRIDSSGRLLLGTTIEGAANANNLTIASSGSAGMTFRSGSSNSANIYFSDATSGAGEYAGYIQYHHPSDYIKFGTAGTDRFLIDSSGFITNTSQPMYSGFGYAGDGSILQSNIPAIRSSNINTNIGSHYNASTGVFTCPVAGKYLCLGNMGRRASSYNWSGLYLLHNGVTKGQSWFPPAIDNTSNYGLPAAFRGSHFTYAPTVMSAILTCSVNDTLVFGYQKNYSAPIDDSGVYYQIVLLG